MWAVASFVSVGCDVRRRHAMMGPFYYVPEMQTEWTGMSDDGWWWLVVVAGGGADVLEVGDASSCSPSVHLPSARADSNSVVPIPSDACADHESLCLVAGSGEDTRSATGIVEVEASSVVATDATRSSVMCADECAVVCDRPCPALAVGCSGVSPHGTATLYDTR